MFQGLVHHFKLLIPHFICFNSRFRWLTHLNLQFIPTRDRPASASHDPWGCKLCFAGRNSIAVAAVELHMNWCHLWVYTDISLHVYMYTHVHSRKDTPYKTNEHIKTFFTMLPMLVILGETMPVSTLELTWWHQWGFHFKQHPSALSIKGYLPNLANKGSGGCLVYTHRWPTNNL